jgi:hypothetical protein
LKTGEAQSRITAIVALILILAMVPDLLLLLCNTALYAIVHYTALF